MKSEVAVISKKKRKKSLQDDMPIWIKIFAYIMTTALSISAIIPFLLTISVSLTQEDALLLHGYKMIPSEFSTAAYEYIFKNSAQIINAYGVTIFTTVAGTVGGVLIMSMLGYVLSRQSFPWKLLRRNACTLCNIHHSISFKRYIDSTDNTCDGNSDVRTYFKNVYEYIGTACGGRVSEDRRSERIQMLFADSNADVSTMSGNNRSFYGS